MKGTLSECIFMKIGVICDESKLSSFCPVFYAPIIILPTNDMHDG